MGLYQIERFVTPKFHAWHVHHFQVRRMRPIANFQLDFFFASLLSRSLALCDSLVNGQRNCGHTLLAYNRFDGCSQARLHVVDSPIRKETNISFEMSGRS